MHRCCTLHASVSCCTGQLQPLAIPLYPPPPPPPRRHSPPTPAAAPPPLHQHSRPPALAFPPSPTGAEEPDGVRARRRRAARQAAPAGQHPPHRRALQQADGGWRAPSAQASGTCAACLHPLCTAGGQSEACLACWRARCAETLLHVWQAACLAVPASTLACMPCAPCR